MEGVGTGDDVSLLPSDLLLVLLDWELALVVETHLGGVGGVWLPRWRESGSANLLHHSVDLLERKTLGLPDEEVGVDVADDTERSPDEEDLGLEVGLVGTDHVWGDDGDDTVPEPVGSGGKGNTSGSNWDWEDLTDADPGTGTPGGGEEEDVDADERDLGLDGGRLLSSGNTDGTDNELANPHAEGSVDEQGSSTESLNGPEGEGSRADVDQSRDEADQERVGDCAQVLL